MATKGKKSTQRKLTAILNIHTGYRQVIKIWMRQKKLYWRATYSKA